MLFVVFKVYSQNFKIFKKDNHEISIILSKQNQHILIRHFKQITLFNKICKGVF